MGEAVMTTRASPYLPADGSATGRVLWRAFPLWLSEPSPTADETAERFAALAGSMATTEVCHG